MRIRYFTHRFIEVATNKMIRHPICDFLDGFCSLDDSQFKNKFRHNGESVFLIKRKSGHYLFIKTKDTDIVQAINRTDITAEEIEQRLNKNESIGFASHAFFTGPIAVFGSTQLGPTISAFSAFINRLLASQEISDYRFIIEPITNQITRDEAKRLPFIGTTTIRVNRQSSLFDDFINVLGINQNNIDDLESFEIIMKPLPRRNIKDINDSLLEVQNVGMEKYEVRAKAELHDRLTEFRIEDTLIAHQDIDQKKTEDIYSLIENAVSGNHDVRGKAERDEEENQVEASSIDGIAQLHSSDAWLVSSRDTATSD